MHKIKLSDEYQLTFLCTRFEINASIQQEIERLLSNPLDWNKIIEIANCHQILPFLYYNLSGLNLQNLVPKNIFVIMKNYHYSNLVRNSLFEKEISLILKSANLKGLTIIPFKGFGLIQTLYYRDPGLRIMADIDILIKEAEFQEIKNILIQIGYLEKKETTEKYHQRYYFETVFSKIFSPNLSLVIEVHRALSPGRPHQIKLPYLWERAQEKTVTNQRLLCLSEEDTFLSLALHLRRHTRRLNLKFIVDIAELLNIYQDELDWLYIAKSAKNNHIIIPVYLSLYLAKELLKANVSLKILNEFRPNIIKVALIRLSINKYNFFTFKKWQGTFLRLLLFDSLIDSIIYLCRVSFLERFVNKQRLRKTEVSVTNKTPISTIDKIKK